MKLFRLKADVLFKNGKDACFKSNFASKKEAMEAEVRLREVAILAFNTDRNGNFQIGKSILRISDISAIKFSVSFL